MTHEQKSLRLQWWSVSLIAALVMLTLRFNFILQDIQVDAGDRHSQTTARYIHEWEAANPGKVMTLDLWFRLHDYTVRSTTKPTGLLGMDK